MLADEPPFGTSLSLRQYALDGHGLEERSGTFLIAPSAIKLLRWTLSPQPEDRPLAVMALTDSWIQHSSTDQIDATSEL